MGGLSARSRTAAATTTSVWNLRCLGARCNSTGKAVPLLQVAVRSRGCQRSARLPFAGPRTLDVEVEVLAVMVVVWWLLLLLLPAGGCCSAIDSRVSVGLVLGGEHNLS